MARLIVLMTAILLPNISFAVPILNEFDENTGANLYSGGLASRNWTANPQYPGFNSSPHAGTQAFLSAFSNSSGLGLTKDLGGAIQDTTYEVSFYIGKYSRLGVPFSDFSTLYIGGPLGVMNWISTPTPTINGEWLKWEGTYTPHASEIGQTFKFGMVFDFVGPTPRGIAIDGAVSATPVPEPSSFLILAMCIGVCAVSIRRNRLKGKFPKVQ